METAFKWCPVTLLRDGIARVVFSGIKALPGSVASAPSLEDSRSFSSSIRGPRAACAGPFPSAELITRLREVIPFNWDFRPLTHPPCGF